MRWEISWSTQRHLWIRVFVVIGPRAQKCDRGHAWMYMGIVRRDAWRAGWLAFGCLRMPARNDDRRSS